MINALKTVYGEEFVEDLIGVFENSKGENKMKNYKENRKYIGNSDIASLRLLMFTEDGDFIDDVLNFGEDGVYHAYIIGEDVEVPSHYHLEKTSYGSITFFSSDDEIVVLTNFGEIDYSKRGKMEIYTAGNFGVIVKLYGDKNAIQDYADFERPCFLLNAIRKIDDLLEKERDDAEVEEKTTEEKTAVDVAEEVAKSVLGIG